MKRCPQCTTLFVDANWICPACQYKPPTSDGRPVLAPEVAENGAAFPTEAFARLAALEAENFWFQARNHLIIWALRRFFPGMQHYLEIGCGTGYVLSGVAQAFPSTELVGSEVFNVGLSIAATRAENAEFIQMDARHIPYADEFDVIGAFDVLEHISEDDDVLNEMSKALRPGGGILVTVPQHPWLWSARDEYARHVRRYRRNELREKMRCADLEVVFDTSFVSLLLPGMAASRLSRRRALGEVNVLAELQIPTLLNRALGACMDLERLLIRAGVRFPFGGSLLLVARKRGESTEPPL